MSCRRRRRRVAASPRALRRFDAVVLLRRRVLVPLVVRLRWHCRLPATPFYLNSSILRLSPVIARAAPLCLCPVSLSYRRKCSVLSASGRSWRRGVCCVVTGVARPLPRVVAPTSFVGVSASASAYSRGCTLYRWYYCRCRERRRSLLLLSPVSEQRVCRRARCVPSRASVRQPLMLLPGSLWCPLACSHAKPLLGPMNATFYIDQPLVYPYVPDYHVAMLVGAGSSLHFSLFVPGTLLSASFIFLLFAFAARLAGGCSSVAAVDIVCVETVSVDIVAAPLSSTRT